LILNSGKPVGAWAKTSITDRINNTRRTKNGERRTENGERNYLASCKIRRKGVNFSWFEKFWWLKNVFVKVRFRFDYEDKAIHKQYTLQVFLTKKLYLVCFVIELVGKG
jgi:hypothetical protein